MAGGPWVQPEDAMRDLIWSRTDVTGGATDIVLPKGQPSGEDWRDYRDICVVAFPTPEGDTGAPLELKDIRGDAAWTALLKGEKGVTEPKSGTHTVTFRAGCAPAQPGDAGRAGTQSRLLQHPGRHH